MVLLQLIKWEHCLNSFVSPEFHHVPDNNYCHNNRAGTAQDGECAWWWTQIPLEMSFLLPPPPQEYQQQHQKQQQQQSHIIYCIQMQSLEMISGGDDAEGGKVVGRTSSSSSLVGI